MAIARFDMTCYSCGKLFEVRREKRNRSDANAYEAWANQTGMLCPSCYRNYMQEQNDKAVSESLNKNGLTLPDLTGVSDKQKDYARSVRSRMLRDNMRYIDIYAKYLENSKRLSSDPAFLKQCEDRGMTFDEACMEALRHAHLESLHVALTAKTAREILDFGK